MSKLQNSFTLRLGSLLPPLGFVQEGKWQYKIDYFDSFSRLIVFSTWQDSTLMATADYCISQTSAERFAIRCLQKTGLPYTRKLKVNGDQDLYLRFPLGDLAGWDFRSSLRLTDASLDIVCTRMVADIQKVLLPLFGSIPDYTALAKFLVRDDFPVAWYRSNTAIRAGAIAWLLRMSGHDLLEIRQALSLLEEKLFVSLGNQFAPTDYVNIILDDLEELHSY